MIQLDSLLKIIHGKYAITYKKQDYLSLEELKKTVQNNSQLVVMSISASNELIRIVVDDTSVVPNDLSGEWVEEHKKQFGCEPSFF